jgi:ABC-2 type transport system permease protein
MMLLYGYALNWDAQRAHGARRPRPHQASRDFVLAFTGSGYFRIVADEASASAIEPLFDRGAARLALVIPAGFGADVAAGRDATVQAVLDGADANTATTILNYVHALAADYDGRLHVRAAAARGFVPPGIGVAPRVWYNPDLNSTFFLLPGLIAFIMMITAVVSTALSVVREKERGTLEQLRLTPLTTTELILGKTAPYLAVSLLAMTIVLVAARVLFGLRIQGDPSNHAVSPVFPAGAMGCSSDAVARQQDAFQIACVDAADRACRASSSDPLDTAGAPARHTRPGALLHEDPARYPQGRADHVVIRGTPRVVAYATLMIGLACSARRSCNA